MNGDKTDNFTLYNNHCVCIFYCSETISRDVEGKHEWLEILLCYVFLTNLF